MKLYDEIFDLVEKIDVKKAQAKQREELRARISEKVKKTVETIVDVLDRTVDAAIENVSEETYGTIFTVTINKNTISFSEEEVLREIVANADIESYIELLAEKENYGEAVLELIKHKLRKLL